MSGSTAASTRALRFRRDYDSLVAKLVVHAPDRDRAIARMIRALRGWHIEGIPTTIPLIQRIVASSAFRAGEVTTDWLDTHLDEMVDGELQVQPEAKSMALPPRRVDVEVNGKRFDVRIHGENAGAPVPAQAGPRRNRTEARSAVHSVNEVISPMHGTVLVINRGVGDAVTKGEALFVVEAMKMENEVPAPRDGRIESISVDVGDTVDGGFVLAELAT